MDNREKREFARTERELKELESMADIVALAGKLRPAPPHGTSNEVQREHTRARGNLQRGLRR